MRNDTKHKKNRPYGDNGQDRRGAYSRLHKGPKTRAFDENGTRVAGTDTVDTDTAMMAADETNGAVVGRNAVRELLRSERPVDKVYVRKGEREGSITMLVAMALEKKIPVVEVEKPKLDMLACGLMHQGIVAMAAQKEYCSVEDILNIAKERDEMPLIIIADNINDPSNLGAIIRTAECAGAHGVIIPKRHASGISPAVTRASAGAVEHMAIAKVSNIAQCVEALKKDGVWTYAAEAGGTDYDTVDYHGPCALVFGSEGEGVSRLVRETCDFVVSIPMYGHVNSLNVSAAAAVIINEAKRGQVRRR